jgi:hypothetical protein
MATLAMSKEREVDLLIAGAGPAGMTAALVANLQGLDVLLCEKSGQVGGTGSTSAGTLWIPGNRQSRDAGFDDSAEQAEEYLDALVASGTNRDLRQAFLQTGPIAIDYLEDNTEVKFLPCGRHPDYRSNMKGAAVVGRAIVPQPFDGRLLGSDFARLRPPIREFMLFGGMMIGKADIAPLIGRFKSPSNFLHAAKLFARYLLDRTPLSARHPPGHGQCTHGEAVFQSQEARRRNPVQRAHRRYCCRQRAGSRRQDRDRGRRSLRKGPQGRRLRHRRLRAQQAIPRGFHAASRAGSFVEQRVQRGRWLGSRRTARRPHRAGGTWR